MAAHQAPSPLPTLSPEDEALLERYFTTGEHLQPLADQPRRSLPDLPPCITRPDIRAWVAAYHQAQDHASIQLARETLCHTARTADDPAHRRRAATQLLRSVRH